MNELTPQTALAEAWASIDGRLDGYRDDCDPGGHRAVLDLAQALLDEERSREAAEG